MAKVRRAQDADGRGSTARKALPDEVARLLVQRVPGSPSAGNGLGPREVEVLRILADGLSRKQIAAALFISPLTVHTHLKNIYVKLDVQNRVQAVNAARSLGLIE